MKYIHFRQVSSTNTYLKTNYKKLDNWTILSASYQSKGRGRLDHTWKSRRGDNLLCSILIKNHKVFKEHESLCLLIAISVYRLLTSLGINNVKIKLPNDVYVNNQKIAGILLETIFLDNKLEALVIGIGLNVNQDTFKEINASSIYLITQKIYDVNMLLKRLVSIIQDELKKVSNNYYPKLLKQYQDVIN